MRRAILSIAAALAVGLGALAVYVYTGVQSLEVRPVTSDVHMLVGWGGNVTVLRTERGAVVIDSMTFRMQGDRIRETAEQVAPCRP